MAKLTDAYVKKFAEVITKRMEQISTDYKQPWIPDHSTPTNLSGVNYRGTNRLFLKLAQLSEGWKYPVFTSFANAKKEDIKIKAGQKALPVLYFGRQAEHKDNHDRISIEKYEELNEAEQAEYRIIGFIQQHHVFNIDQTDIRESRPDLYEKIDTKQIRLKEADRIHVLEDLITNNKWRCPISLDSKDSAFYSLSKDEIHLPKKETFVSYHDFYSTALHEMAHSTMKPLEREVDVKDMESYGREELVAELSSALAGDYYAVDKAIKDNNTNYLKGWLEIIDKSPEFLQTVLNDVGKASNFMVDHIDQTQSTKVEKSEILQLYSNPFSSKGEELQLHNEADRLLSRISEISQQLTLPLTSKEEIDLIEERYQAIDAFRSSLRKQYPEISFPEFRTLPSKITMLESSNYSFEEGSSLKVLDRLDHDTFMGGIRVEDSPELRTNLESNSIVYSDNGENEILYKGKIRFREGYTISDTEAHKEYLETNEIHYEPLSGGKLFVSSRAKNVGKLLAKGIEAKAVAGLVMMPLIKESAKRAKVENTGLFSKAEIDRLVSGNTIFNDGTQKYYYIDQDLNQLRSLPSSEVNLTKNNYGIKGDSIEKLKAGNTLEFYSRSLKLYVLASLDFNRKDGIRVGLKKFKSDKEFTFVPTPNSPEEQKIKYIQLKGVSGLNDIYDRGGANLEKNTFLNKYDVLDDYKNFCLEPDRKKEKDLLNKLNQKTSSHKLSMT